jgi:type II secretory pathway pseudopilin PulG
MWFVCRSNCARLPRSGERVQTQAGAVLLEVVLALVLFVGAATVLTSGLSSSLDAVERLRLNTHAADLAVSVLSELQLGIKTASLSGPQPFDSSLEGWTWEIISGPLHSEFEERTPFHKVEVIIRHAPSTLVYRLTQVVPAQPGRTTVAGQPEATDLN